MVICGPSGSGKSSFETLKVNHGNYTPVVSCTTRKKRPWESHGVNYFFLEPEDFEAAYFTGDMIERNEFAGNQYGVRTDSINNALKSSNAIIVVDINGASALCSEHVKCLLPKGLRINVVYMDASFYILAKRTKQRDGFSKDYFLRLFEIVRTKCTWRRRLRKLGINYVELDSTYNTTRILSRTLDRHLEKHHANKNTGT